MKKVIQIGLLVMCVGLMPKIAQAAVNNNTNYSSISETVKATALTAEQEFEQLKPFLESKDTEGKTNAEKIGLREGTTGTKLADYNDIIVDKDGYVVKIYWGMKDLVGDLNVSNFTKLTNLYCWENKLTSLDLTNLTALAYLDCINNQLTNLDVSRLFELKELSCGGNQLTSLDVSNLTALSKLYCFRNKLTNLDVSKLTALTELSCSYNQLTMNELKKTKALKNLNSFSYNPQSILGKSLDNSKYYLASKGDIKSLGTDSSTYKWSDETIGSNYDFSDKIGRTMSCIITDGDIFLDTNFANIIENHAWEQMELEEAITKSKQILDDKNSTAKQIVDMMKDLADAMKNYGGDKNISK